LRVDQEKKEYHSLLEFDLESGMKGPLSAQPCNGEQERRNPGEQKQGHEVAKK